MIVINCSQKWLAVVNLDQPEDYSEPKAVRKLGRQNKYEIKAVLWNPHLVKEDLLASTVSVCVIHRLYAFSIRRCLKPESMVAR